MYFHASNTANIKVLLPKVSNHGKALVYLSDRKENVLPYLSNAIEKFCKETRVANDGIFQKWASYGFNKDGVLVLEEYYPNALMETYFGVSAYIYGVSTLTDFEAQADIPHAFVSKVPVEVTSCEHIPNAYDAIMQAKKANKIIVRYYNEQSEASKQWIENTILADYNDPNIRSEYKAFLKAKFDFLR